MLWFIFRAFASGFFSSTHSNEVKILNQAEFWTSNGVLLEFCVIFLQPSSFSSLCLTHSWEAAACLTDGVVFCMSAAALGQSQVHSHCLWDLPVNLVFLSLCGQAAFWEKIKPNFASAPIIAVSVLQAGVSLGALKARMGLKALLIYVIFLMVLPILCLVAFFNLDYMQLLLDPAAPQSLPGRGWLMVSRAGSEKKNAFII